jgi:hypothetical protein
VTNEAPAKEFKIKLDIIHACMKKDAKTPWGEVSDTFINDVQLRLAVSSTYFFKRRETQRLTLQEI